MHELPSAVTNREQAIAMMIEARDIHQDYIEYFERCLPNPTLEQVAYAEIVGGLEWHQRWVDNYNVVLKVLEDGD